MGLVCIFSVFWRLTTRPERSDLTQTGRVSSLCRSVDNEPVLLSHFMAGLFQGWAAERCQQLPVTAQLIQRSYSYASWTYLRV